MRIYTYYYVTFGTVFLCLCDGDIFRKDLYSNALQMVSAAGYPIEKHYARTEDGYILQLFRIPNGRSATKKHGGGKKKAVVLVHGLIGSCENFIIMGPDRSLAYLLADAGYDVWLANLRGTYYTTHRKLTRSDAAFWDYSFHEHGLYDGPAFIDYILKVTGLKQILYIGHSMGCTTFLIMTAMLPEYNDKLVAFVGLAPAGYMNNIKILANFMINSVDITTVLKTRAIYSITIPRDILVFVCDRYCNAKQPQSEVCWRIVFGLVGEDYEQLDWNMTKSVLVRTQPASLRQIYHFSKIALTGTFTSWEGGFLEPGTPYNLTNIRTPVSLRYGENDLLTEKSQVLRLAKELNDTGTLYSLEPVSWRKFNHMDFLYAKDIRELVNVPLVNHVQELFRKFYIKK